jgi:hypothetical protein
MSGERRGNGVMEYWSGGVVEWWSGGVVEWWSGGVVECILRSAPRVNAFSSYIPEF